MANQKYSESEIEMLVESRDYLLDQLRKLKDDFEDFPDDALVRHREYMGSRVNRCLNALQQSMESSNVIQFNCKQA